MVHARGRILKIGRQRQAAVAAAAIVAAVLIVWVRPLHSARFRADDPLWREPPPLRAGKLAKRELDPIYNHFENRLLVRRVKSNGEHLRRARAVNTLGEAPDSAWFTNRLGMQRMTAEELARGPARGNAPSEAGPWTVVSAKTQGATPGLIIEDVRGRRYVLKFDPPGHLGLTTAPDVIGSKFFHAFGYNVPENYIVRFERSRLAVSPKATLKSRNGGKRRMEPEDIDDLLAPLTRLRDGRYRAMASFFIPGEPIGPFEFHGTRADDPNDIVPHEDRRDLRGLYVFAAWLNNYDCLPLNTYDAVQEEGSLRYVRHYLIDFGSMLGAGPNAPREPRDGYEYEFDFIPALAQIFSLGAHVPAWQRAVYPRIAGVGRFESAAFDPREWKPSYTNPAFESRLPDDTYWAARKLMLLADADIRAVVETGEYDDPRAAEWITRALIERRNKIGRAFLTAVLALDDFRVEDGRLVFQDLAVKYGFVPARRYQVEWSLFDNVTERKRLLAGETSFNLPRRNVADGYLAADIRSDDPSQSVTVYLQNDGGVIRVVGVDRSW